MGSSRWPRSTSTASCTAWGRPIRPDYVGKNLPTSLDEDVRVRLTETDDGADDGVELWGPGSGAGGEGT